MPRRLVILAAALLLLAGAGWLFLGSDDDDRDWSALTPVAPDLAAPWEPSPDLHDSLTGLDACAVLRSLDGEAGEVERLAEGCRTTPRRDDLAVWVVADSAVEDPGAFAYSGGEHDVAGYTAWVIPSAVSGQCSAFLPAGPTHGLVVRAAAGELCAGLPERLSSTLQAWQRTPERFQRAVTDGAGSLPFTPFGEASIRGTGACADLAQQWARQCAEHSAGELPEDPAERIRQGEADPDVVCTAALDAAAALDVDARAVTAVEPEPNGSRACVLLIGERESTVWVSASRSSLGSGDLEFAGHAARKNQFDAPAYDIALGDPDDPGKISVLFEQLDGSLTEPEWGQEFLSELARTLLD